MHTEAPLGPSHFDAFYPWIDKLNHRDERLISKMKPTPG